ncbi:hypothetical protein WJR50_28985 [Catalinimonas sp. 4WD22]|uniref:hypothetical protein n=1 Tax=Catalinimonas locisalis TaxID=3133978 RepID=UPI00310148D8
MAEVRTAGLLLSIGSLITIVCILMEVYAGWASLSVEMKRTDYEAGVFLFNHWPQMKSIWGWSLFGNVFLAIAALLLQKNASNVGVFPASVLWSIYFIGCLLLIISFGLSLGSYYPALEVIEQQPAIFVALRGTPLYLFDLGAISGLVLFIIYFYEGFSKQGIVSRKWAIAALSCIIVSIVLVSVGFASFTVFAIACFFVPLFLGASYWRYSSVQVSQEAIHKP